MNRVVLSSVLGIILSAAAFDQAVTGSLSGTVLDANNAAVPGATVDTR